MLSQSRNVMRLSRAASATGIGRTSGSLQYLSSATSPDQGSYHQPSYTTPLQYAKIDKSNFGKYKEYSVIHTDRSLNLMSDPFQQVMRDLNNLLKITYNAEKAVIVPGSGTFGMESVARQFATNKHVMVIRNGWFSYRWTEILEMGSIPTSHTVLKAVPVPIPNSARTHFAPHPIEQVIQRIREERPAVVFAPHVETSTGMMLSDSYMRQVSAAVHDVGGIFVLDCIASGTVWIDMKLMGVDVLITAPQKGWTGPPCAALVQLSKRATDLLQSGTENSFSLSLKRWSAIMDTYEKGGFGYHTTMPTDALRDFHEISVETLQMGLPTLREAQLDLGRQVRAVLESKGLISVAAPGFQAPGVAVYYSPAETENPLMMSKFKEQGLQIAMGVPWKIDEPDGLKTFRIGLFGLDKLANVPRTVQIFEDAINNVLKTTSDLESKVA